MHRLNSQGFLLCSSAIREMRYLHLLVLVLLGVLHPVACEQYYCIKSISTGNVESNSSCLSLYEFASSNFSGSSSITLTFLPGNHYLDIELSVFSTEEFRLLGSDSENSSVQCGATGKVIVDSVDNVSISNLKFMGCGGNNFTYIRHFHIENTAFYGTEYNHTALVLSGVMSAEISNSSFITN